MYAWLKPGSFADGVHRLTNVARLRCCGDSQPNLTADVEDVYKDAFDQGQFHMAGIVRVAESFVDSVDRLGRFRSLGAYVGAFQK